jgi:hypothetical protein
VDGLDGMAGGENTVGVDGPVPVAAGSGAASALGTPGTIGLSAIRTDRALTAFDIDPVPVSSLSVTPVTRADRLASPAVATTINLPLRWVAGARWAPVERVLTVAWPVPADRRAVVTRAAAPLADPAA